MAVRTIIKDVKAEKIISAPKAELFKILADHEGTSNWIEEVEKVVLLKDGANKIGLGAIRQVDFKPKLWTTIEEEIIEFSENQSYTYQIIDGMPGLLQHKGRWILSDHENGSTKVIWDVHFEFKKFHWFGLLVNNFAKSFHQIQIDALESLAKYVHQ